MLEYQNKALASLVKRHKQKIDSLSSELASSSTQRANLEANLATLATKLDKVSNQSFSSNTKHLLSMYLLTFKFFFLLSDL